MTGWRFGRGLSRLRDGFAVAAAFGAAIIIAFAASTALR